MAKTKEAIVVEQHWNVHYNKTKPENQTDNCQYAYKVVKTINTIEVAISEIIGAEKLNKLINRDIAVTVQPVK